jgi:lysyl-tRNA synthetase class 2
VAEAETLSPADLGRTLGGVARVGGRVLGLDGAGIVLADALGRAIVTLSVTPPELALGDFVVVVGRVDASGKLYDARIEERHPAATPRGDGDFARYCLQGVGQRLRFRSAALSQIRAYFAAESFIEVDAPCLVPAPGLDGFVTPIACGSEYLATSPEFQLKRMLAGGLPRMYFLGHVLRGDEAGPWHEREFCMLEWYRAFSGMDAIRRDTETIVRQVAACAGSVESVPLHDGRSIDLSLPFLRMTVREAFRTWAGTADACALALHDETQYFQTFVDLVEPGLAGLERPVFLEQYPATQAALSKLSPEDPSVAQRMELYLGGVELANGFVELTDAAEQRKRFEMELARRNDSGLCVDERFLSALTEGMPPCSGIALGVDRLLALCAGLNAIQPVLPFPRDCL